MMVNSPLAIYSVVIGAKLYDDIFNIIVSFGILYVPLIIVFAQAIKAYFDCSHGSATSMSLNKVILGLASYILVVMLALVPTQTLKVNSIGYTPACSNNAKIARFGNSGTTYDTVFQKYEYDNIRLPLLMAFVLEGASGFTNAAISMLPCKTDVQKIQGIVNTTNLNRELVDEVKRFSNECYTNALTQFDTQKPDNKKYASTYNKYGQDSDLGWIGSHVLQELYYDNLYALAPTKPFPYALFTDYTLEKDRLDNKKTAPEFGFPSCGQWWSSQTYGLQKRLINLAEENAPGNEYLGNFDLLREVGQWRELYMQTLNAPPDRSPAEDIIARGILTGNALNAGFGSAYNGWVSNNLKNDKIINTLSTIAGQANMGVKATMSAVKRYEMAQEIPIVQAVLFVLFLSLGPIIMILGRLQVHVITSYYFILCSSIFIPFLIKMINYLEQSVHQSMGYGLYASEQFSILYVWFTNFYYYIPLVYLMIMSISGVQIGSAMSQFMGQSISTGGGSGIIARALTRMAK